MNYSRTQKRTKKKKIPSNLHFISQHRAWKFRINCPANYRSTYVHRYYHPSQLDVSYPCTNLCTMLSPDRNRWSSRHVIPRCSSFKGKCWRGVRSKICWRDFDANARYGWEIGGKSTSCTIKRGRLVGNVREACKTCTNDKEEGQSTSVPWHIGNPSHGSRGAGSHDRRDRYTQGQVALSRRPFSSAPSFSQLNRSWKEKDSLYCTVRYAVNVHFHGARVPCGSDTLLQFSQLEIVFDSKLEKMQFSTGNIFLFN